MNTLSPLSFFVVLSTVALMGAVSQPSAVAQESRQAETETQKLFDGESLKGWSGDEKLWRVEDGSIVGQTTKENSLEKNTFLIWQGGDVTDFELRLKYKMDGGNSGVQIRSKVVEGFRVHGYQADFDAGNSYTGIWYEEGGRGILVPRCKQVTVSSSGERQQSPGEVDEPTYVAGLKANDWNEVVITARGNTLTHSINGNVSAVLVDNQEEKAKSAGILALQLHVGPPMKIEFKDIELTVFDD